MKVQLLLYHRGDEKPDHRLMFDMPGVPQTGDCITISRPDQAGCTNFIVRRIQWALDCPNTVLPYHADESDIGATSAVTIECELAIGPYSSEEHKRTDSDIELSVVK